MRRFICLAGVTAAGFMVAAAPASATIPVTPTAQCETTDPATGIVSVYFGYVNTGTLSYFIAVGDDNLVVPGDPFQGQPETFNVGTYPRVFQAEFDPTLVSGVTWVLNGITLTEGASSLPSCDSLSSTGAALLDGSGPPASTLGQDGDFYLDTTNEVLYGPKANGAWPAGVSLVGPQGTPGTPGIQGPPGQNGANGNTILNGAGPPSSSIGNNGDFYIDTTNHVMYGPKANGVWPATGISLVGPPGPTGPQGPPGMPVCRNTGVTILICDALFVPGTWTVGPKLHATDVLSREQTVYARGTGTVTRSGRVALRLRKLRQVKRGRYTLTVRLTSSRLHVTVRRMVSIR